MSSTQLRGNKKLPIINMKLGKPKLVQTSSRNITYKRILTIRPDLLAKTALMFICPISQFKNREFLCTSSQGITHLSKFTPLPQSINYSYS